MEHETHATHYLQLELHARFREANVQNEVGLRAFELLKPFYIRRLKERNTCACRYYCEMAELRAGWNNMRTATKGIYDRRCDCSCEVCMCSKMAQSRILEEGSNCHADLTHFISFTDIWHSVLCSVEGDGWHAPKCIKGTCDLCGVNMLQLCPREMDNEGPLMVQWHNFEMVVHGRTRVGKENKVLRMKYRLHQRQFIWSM
ncbi:hypothetical protein M758_UG104500 [Ceratodon purpureus]|nr:hypothetical protein M758_UG104500 [Ceratodon purpureus]